MTPHEAITPDVQKYLQKKSEIKSPLALPKRETLPKPLLETADHIAEITGTWNPVELYTPANSREEKERFITAFRNEDIYSPEFNYDNAEQFQLGTSKQELAGLLHIVNRFRPQNHAERLARIGLYFKVRDDLATTALVEGLQSKNEKMIADALHQKYPGIDSTIWQIAQTEFSRLIKTPAQASSQPTGILDQSEIDYLQRQKFSAEEIQQAFIWMLEQYGILKTDQKKEGFAVKIDEHATSIDVRDKSVSGPTIFIPKDRKVNGIDLLKLIGHEGEGHARQSVNGQRLFVIGGGNLKIDNEMLYEGLGKRYDDHLSRKLTGEDTGVPLPYYTYGIRASERGHTFSDIFKEQFNMRLQVEFKEPDPARIPHLKDIESQTTTKALDSAWLTTYRVMRGHIDTSNQYPFAMAKDLAYLRGYQIDQELQRYGIGFLNESAVIASGGLQLLAEFAITEDDLPLPYKDVATSYWEKILKPQMKKT